MLGEITHLILDTADPNWIDYWKDGKWFKGALAPYVHLLGRPAMALLLGGPFTLGLWIQTESVLMPATILALFMGLMLAGAPAEAAIVGYIIVVIGTVIAYRSISGVGTR
jgi:hypothetical protein